MIAFELIWLANSPKTHQNLPTEHKFNVFSASTMFVQFKCCHYINDTAS